MQTTNQTLEKRLCQHKKLISEVLLNTKTKCEECSGYDADCKNYRPILEHDNYFEIMGDV